MSGVSRGVNRVVRGVRGSGETSRVSRVGHGKSRGSKMLRGVYHGVKGAPASRGS